MQEFETLSYTELRCKEVVNILDGRRLGRIVDIVFTGGKRAHIKGIVVPHAKRFFVFRDKELFIPWHCVKQIGSDVILVELILEECAPKGKRVGGSKYDAIRHEIHGGGHSHEQGREHGEEKHGHKNSQSYNGTVHSTNNSKSCDDCKPPQLFSEPNVYTQDIEKEDIEVLQPPQPSPQIKKPVFDASFNKGTNTATRQAAQNNQSDKTACGQKCETCTSYNCKSRWKNI